jgi:hypothetical protein
LEAALDDKSHERHEVWTERARLLRNSSRRELMARKDELTKEIDHLYEEWRKNGGPTVNGTPAERWRGGASNNRV